MPFEIGKTVNGGAEWVCSSSIVFGMINNPVSTALLITALVLIMIYSMYTEELKGTGWRRGLKTGIWIAIGVSSLVFIHYYAFERHLRKDNALQGVRDMMASIHHSAATSDGYAVYAGSASEDDEARGNKTALGAQNQPDAHVAPGPAASTQTLNELGLQPAVILSTPGSHV